MELSYAAHPLGAWRKKRSAEMQRTLFLAETGTRYQTHARRVEQLHAVELIGRHAMAARLVDGPGRQVDRGEEVHGTLRVILAVEIIQ